VYTSLLVSIEATLHIIFWRFLTFGDLKLKVATPVTPVLEDVRTNFALFTPNAGQTNRQTNTQTADRRMDGQERPKPVM